jgi:two-component system, response regulator
MLLDLHMPKIDGLEVLAQIKADPRTRATPVVIMSSSDQESDMVASYAAHANGYIVKPFTFQELQGKLLEFIGPGSGCPPG